MTTDRKISATRAKAKPAKTASKVKSRSAVARASAQADEKSSRKRDKAANKVAASRQQAGMDVDKARGKVAAKKKAQAKAVKPPREKRVRDDFKMPQRDYALIEALKQRALEFKRPTKKNELLRAGLQALGAMNNAQLEHQLASLAAASTKAL